MSTHIWKLPYFRRSAQNRWGVFVEHVIKSRLKELAKSKGVPMSQVLKDVGLNPGFVTDIGRKSSSPASDKLIKLANYFDVSTEYLLGRTDDPRNYIINPDYDSFIIQRDPGGPFEKFPDLPEDYQKQIIEFYNSFVERHFKEVGEAK